MNKPENLDKPKSRYVKNKKIVKIETYDVAYHRFGKSIASVRLCLDKINITEKKHDDRNNISEQRISEPAAPPRPWP